MFKGINGFGKTSSEKSNGIPSEVSSENDNKKKNKKK